MCKQNLLKILLIYFLFVEEIHCIDYEYGCPNYAAYDIANNFNEFAGLLLNVMYAIITTTNLTEKQ